MKQNKSYFDMLLHHVMMMRFTFYPTELQNGEQEDCGQDSPDTHKDQIYENEIHVGLSGVHSVTVCQHVYLKGPFVLKVITAATHFVVLSILRIFSKIMCSSSGLSPINCQLVFPVAS